MEPKERDPSAAPTGRGIPPTVEPESAGSTVPAGSNPVEPAQDHASGRTGPVVVIDDLRPEDLGGEDFGADDLANEAYDGGLEGRPALFPAGSLALAGLVLGALTLMPAATDLLVVLPFINGPTSRDQGLALAVGYVVVAGIAALLGALGALSAQVDGDKTRSWRVEVGRAAVIVGLLGLLLHAVTFFTLLAQSNPTSGGVGGG